MSVVRHPAVHRVGRTGIRIARRPRRGVHSVPWVALLPAVLFLIAFQIAPGIAGGYYSLTDWNGIDPDSTFVGTANFRAILDEPAVRGALVRTLVIAAVFVVAVNAVGLVLALGLNRTVKTRHFLRSVFFLPAILSPVVTAFVWQYVLQNDGVLNTVLAGVGLESWTRVWLGEPFWAVTMILVVMVWQFSGLCMVIYLAGLQGIPQELDEAAAIDGASTFQRFRAVTWPALAPAVTTSATLTMIFGLRVFDQVLALTGGGPAGSTETLATQVWQQSFAQGRFGLGAALAVALAALVALVSVTQALALRAREE